MDNTLQHYGILGMKWGVRRSDAQLSRARGSKKDESSSRKAKSMSDDELRKAVNRLQLEKQYQQLSGSAVNRGKSYAQKVFKVGTTVAAVTTTAITIYNNAGKIKEIVEKIGTK